MRVAILGFGLIGGSVALALKDTADASAAAGSFTVTAWSPSGLGASNARSQGVVDDAPRRIEDALADAELVLLAAPPLACLDLLGRLGGPLRGALDPGATITDVASTKARIVNVAGDLELPFVGGHPMAGREIAGFGAATANLFTGRPWVVVPGAHARPTDVLRVESLARATGAKPVRLGAREHDAVVAAVSHLPLVLAAALVETVLGSGSRSDGPDEMLARQLAASGWRDMTRLARGDVDMGAGIAATNAGPLAGRLREARLVLDRWIADLDQLDGQASPDVSAITARFQAAKDRLEG